MANENMIKFLRGNVANLPQTATAGALYFTKDEGIYLGMEDGSYHRYGDFITVADVNSLPVAGAHETCMYYCIKENILAKWDKSKNEGNGGWVQINKQPTAEEMKTLLGLGDLAYLSEVSEDNLDADLKAKVDLAHSHTFNEDELNKIAEGDVEKWGEAYAHSQADHAPVDAQANVIETVKVNGEALEITDKAVNITIPESTKVEASETNGNIKVDGEEVTVYTHPEKHTIAEVDGLQDALDGKSDDGHKHTKEDITDFAHTHTAAEITDLDDTIKGYDYATKEEAKGYADAKDEAIAAAQKSADDLAKYVGTIPETATATDIVGYVQEKTAGIATDAALEELVGRVAATEGDIAAINNAETGILAQAKAYVNEEDKFEIDMVTVNAHGGVAAGEDLNGLTTHEILKKILYPYVQPVVGNATASPNGGTYEKGVTKTITQVSISVTKKSEPITSVALYNGSTLIEDKTGDAVKNGGTITFSGLNVVVPTDGNQLTVKVTDAKGTVQEKKTTALTFVYPYYMGSCAAGTAIDETLVESLTKKIESKGNKSNSFTVSDGHMVFAYPKAHGVLKSILDPNNFETIGNYTRSEVSVTGLDGTAQTYYVYTSGATTVSGFVVNFKY